MTGFMGGIVKSWRDNLARLILPLGRKKVWIFNFHRVVGDHEFCTGSTPFVRASTFEKLVCDIGNCFHVISLDQLVSSPRCDNSRFRCICALTFDDGWKNVYHNAFPVLRRLGLPATIFLPVGFIGTSKMFWQDLLCFALGKLYGRRDELDDYLMQVTGAPARHYLGFLGRPATVSSIHRSVVRAIKSFPGPKHRQSIAAILRLSALPGFAPPDGRALLNWQEVREMQQCGIDFGSHGMWHEMLTRLPYEEARREVFDSKAELERLLGKPVRFFAYPNDDFNPRIAGLVSEAGYTAAFIQRDRPVGQSDGYHDIPRFEIREDLVTTKTGKFSPGLLQLRFSTVVLGVRRTAKKLLRRWQRGKRLRPIRLGFIIDFMPGPIAGTEKQLLELLRRLDRRRVQPHLVILKRPRDTEMALFGLSQGAYFAWLDYMSKAWPLRRLRCGPSLVSLKGVRGLIRLVSYLTTRRIDIVQTFFADSCLMGLVAGILTRKKVIVSRRSCGHDDTRGQVFFLSLLSRFASRILANSRAAADAWRERGLFRHPPVNVLRNGVDVEAIQAICRKGQQANRRKLGLPPAAKIVGAIANMRSVKALHVLLDAAEVVLTRHPDALFVLVGSGPLEGELKDRSRRLGIEEKVLFAGQQKEVASYLASFDVGVLPSLSEGLSNAILEYMAAGLPVVATGVGGNKELVDDGVTGFLVRPRDSAVLANGILKLIEDNDLRVRMGEAALAKAQSEFSVEKMVLAHEDYYESVFFDAERGIQTAAPRSQPARRTALVRFLPTELPKNACRMRQSEL